MSRMIPIQGLEPVIDRAYRWTMPMLISTAKKQGTNGAFTLISNMASPQACGVWRCACARATNSATLKVAHPHMGCVL